MIDRFVARWYMFWLEAAMFILVLGITDDRMDARLRLKAVREALPKAESLWRLHHIRSLRRA
jgi:hypothetical protein